VTGIDVHGDVGEVKRLQSVGDAVLVAAGGVLAVRKVGVGDQVWKGVGSMMRARAMLGYLLMMVMMAGDFVSAIGWKCGSTRGRTIDVRGLVCCEIAGCKFAVGGFGGTVTAGEVVDDEASDLVPADVLEFGLELCDVRDCIAIPF
jgi:hypothetical protein